MFEQDVLLETFLEFATESTLNAVSVLSVIDHEVETINSNGEVGFMEHLVTLKKEDSVFSKSDLLLKDGKNYSLQDIHSDDGILVEIAALSYD